MAEGSHRFTSALAAVALPGRRYGRNGPDPGVIVREIRGAGLATVAPRQGRRLALLAEVRSAFGVDLPATPKRVLGHEIAFIWSGPDRWLATKHPAPKEGMEAFLAALAGLASLVDESHGRTLLRVSGSRVRDALAKGVPVDLHPCAFKPGDVAITLVAHVPVTLCQIDERPTYEFAVARSLAQSFWQWLATAAAEYGLVFSET